MAGAAQWGIQGARREGCARLQSWGAPASDVEVLSRVVRQVRKYANTF